MTNRKKSPVIILLALIPIIAGGVYIQSCGEANLRAADREREAVWDKTEKDFDALPLAFKNERCVQALDITEHHQTAHHAAKASRWQEIANYWCARSPAYQRSLAEQTESL